MAAGPEPDYIKPQIIFILCGLPGSGKSYFARKVSEPFEDGSTPNIVTLCQGTASREEFKELFIQTSKAKRIVDEDGKFVRWEMNPLKLPHVIIDRCNSKSDDRLLFTRLVNNDPIVSRGATVSRRIICLVHFNFSEFYCTQLLDRRLKMKEDHPTVHDKETANKAMFLHKKMFQNPSGYEINKTNGDRFVRISSPEQMDNFIKKARRWL